MWLRLGLGQWLPELGGNSFRRVRDSRDSFTLEAKRGHLGSIYGIPAVSGVCVCVEGGGTGKN